MKESSSLDSRIIYLDVLRIVSLFFMIMMHVSAQNWYTIDVNTFEWLSFETINGFTRFCVPVFIMISGSIFLNPDNKITVKKLFGKSIPRIYIAFLFWSFLYAIVPVIQNKKTLDNKESLISFIKTWLQGHYHLWYIYAIIGLYVAVPLLREWSKNQVLLKYFLFVSFMMAGVVPLLQLYPVFDETKSITQDANLTLFSGYVFYYIAGYYLHKYEVKDKFRYVLYIIAIISMFFAIVFSCKISLDSGEPNKSLYGTLMPQIMLESMAVFLFIKQLCNHIKITEKVKKVIVLLSELTFGSYLIHDFILQMLKSKGINTMNGNPVVSVFFITFITFCFSLLGVCIIKKIPIINKFVS